MTNPVYYVWKSSKDKMPDGTSGRLCFLEEIPMGQYKSKNKLINTYTITSITSGNILEQFYPA